MARKAKEPEAQLVVLDMYDGDIQHIYSDVPLHVLVRNDCKDGQSCNFVGVSRELKHMAKDLRAVVKAAIDD